MDTHLDELTATSVWKEVCSHPVSKFFPFRVDPFSEGIGSRKANRKLNKLPPFQKWRKIYQMWPVPLRLHCPKNRSRKFTRTVTKQYLVSTWCWSVHATATRLYTGSRSSVLHLCSLAIAFILTEYMYPTQRTRSYQTSKQHHDVVRRCINVMFPLEC